VDQNKVLARMAATLDSVADGILVIDLEGRVFDFNRRFLEIIAGVSRMRRRRRA
jgi:PAS domain S-box-containing protein